MSASDIYAYGVLNSHTSSGSLAAAQAVIAALTPSINTWANGHLFGIYPAGSVAKGTAISGTSDVDILISVKDTAAETLQEVYEKLFNRLTTDGFTPRRQNVSLGVTINGLKVDVVPAKKQSTLNTTHSLWSHKKQTWRETNIHEHINYVTSSGRLDEIRLVKVWRKLHGLEFPSFPLEVLVVEALNGYAFDDIALNFAQVLTYIRDTLPTARLIDPTKPSNILSDELTVAEKALLSSTARDHLNKTWAEVVW